MTRGLSIPTVALALVLWTAGTAFAEDPAPAAAQADAPYQPPETERRDARDDRRDQRLEQRTEGVEERHERRDDRQGARGDRRDARRGTGDSTPSEPNP